MKKLIAVSSLVFFVLVFLVSGPALGDIYVPDDYPDIQSALDAAMNYEIVIVRDDTYTGAKNKNLDFGGKAIWLRSENGPEDCIIDCADYGEGPGRGFTFDSDETTYMYLSGFTIINGSPADSSGGGILCRRSSPTIFDCIIESCPSPVNGGGIYIHSASPTIFGCVIRNNSADCVGGGVYCYNSSPTITYCTINGNRARYVGGISCSYASSATITYCTINGNRATATYGYGGGISCSYASPATITYCIISGNRANYIGGGISCSYDSSPEITNCIISDNEAMAMDGDGGGIHCRDSSPTITHCTISGNSADHIGGGISCPDSSPSIVNCILWNNSASQGREIALYESSSLTVKYSDVQGGEAAAYVESGCTLNLDGEPGNIDADPLFAGGGNYHLTPSSPCIDAATDAEVYTDIDGEPRPMGTGFDMGADEFLFEVPDTYVVPDDFPTIQEALDCVPDGSEITVRDGTYTGDGNKNLDFGGKAITLSSENGPDDCVIDCKNSGRGFYFHSGETSDTIVDGFTIKNGSGSYGGGVYCGYSSPTITDCTIKSNTASNYGGGIFCSYSWPSVTGCIISGNSASVGGGISCRDSSPSITNCTIKSNTASNYGSGISCLSSSPTIANCTISDNSSSSYGGGIFCCDSSATITNCILWGDSAPYGPEIALYESSSLTVTYSDVECGEAAAFVQFNCILAWGEGNTDGNPLFVGGGDYHLTASSPCIDAGTDAGVYTDIDGETRPMGTGFDMGSDEYVSPDLTQINLQSPAHRALLTSPPTFAWTVDGGTNNAYIVDTGFGGRKKSFEVDASGWTMPGPVWDNIRSGTVVSWRVRGMNLDHTPPTVVVSDEVWSFTKQ